MTTPAEHAATVRDDATELEKAIRQHVPDGYDQVELNHDGPLRRECLERLAHVVARAERATELEAENERLRGAVSLRGQYRDEWLERAEQLETALRQTLADHPSLKACPYCGPRNRAALDGGTATPEPTE